MGWGKELELQRQKKLGMVVEPVSEKGKKKTKNSDLVSVKRKPTSNVASATVPVAIVCVAAVARTVWKRRFQLEELWKKHFPNTRFPLPTSRFPHANKKQSATRGAGSSSNEAAAAGIGGKPSFNAAPRTDNLPRNKSANNKKNKARKKEKKEQKVTKQAQDEAVSEAARVTTEKAAKNQMPKEEDIEGGALGKTFTTTSHIKVSQEYAKIRQTVGKE